MWQRHNYKCGKDTLIECVFATFFSNHSDSTEGGWRSGGVWVRAGGGPGGPNRMYFSFVLFLFLLSGGCGEKEIG